MEHNLDDSLNLDSSMGVEFDHAEDIVVNQEDISLDPSGPEENIPMEYEHIEERPIQMDTGNQEVIGNYDFIGEQFTLQEYSIEDNQTSGATTTVEANQLHMMTSQSDMVDLQYEQDPLAVPASNSIHFRQEQLPKITNVKSMPSVRPIAPKKETVVVSKVAPRQIAIAPKPAHMKNIPIHFPKFSQTKVIPGKEYAIAPKPYQPAAKPVTLVANQSVVKKMSLGKQLVMVSGGATQKVKLVSTGSGAVRLVGAANSDQAKLIATQPGHSSNKVMTKVIVQGASKADLSNAPAVITKLGPAGAHAQARFVTVQQKAVPITIGNNKVIMTSPSKFVKKPQQISTIRSPAPKLMPAAFTQGITTKKVMIKANPSQNVVLKSSKLGQNTKTIGQGAQLHQINVPGKGIQYIRLVTNPSASAQKKVIKTQSNVTQAKAYVLADNKGNLIQMSAEKLVRTPPPLVVTSGVSTITKVTSNPSQKLVRIAPVTSKSNPTTMQPVRGQSLLAPLSPAAGAGRGAREGGAGELLEVEVEADHTSPDVEPQIEEPGEDAEHEHEEEIDEHNIKHEEVDSKTALRALIADAVGSDAESHDSSSQQNDQSRSFGDVEVEFERQSPQADDSDSREHTDSQSNHPLIVIPSSMKHERVTSDDHSSYVSGYLGSTANHEHEHGLSTGDDNIRIEVDPYNTYQTLNTSQALSESDMVSTELGLRPRKACNCTKSQCLKLYCDCFANGEFCNNCNCNNCHNNLDNEELRQKAIRGCLDRNPNAFRPKIGKTKIGGPEIIRRHNKGCNCKRSGCLKNYCECYEAKIACTAICKCVGCRNVEETLERSRRAAPPPRHAPPPACKQPCSFMTSEVIEAVCQCLVAAAAEGGAEPDPVRDVIEEFARCLHDIIGASHRAAPPPSPADHTQQA